MVLRAAGGWEEEVGVGGRSWGLRLRIVWSRQLESESSLVRLVATSQTLLLLFDPSSPPLSLLLRLALALSSWRPSPLFRSPASMSFGLLPSKPLLDPSSSSLTLEERRDIEERDLLLANSAIVALRVLYSHGYRQTSRLLWVPQLAPVSSIVDGFAFVTHSHSVTLWGEVPPEILSLLQEEFTQKPFVSLQHTDLGHGIPGWTFAFRKQEFGEQLLTQKLQQMRTFLSQRVKSLGHHLLIASWSLSVFFFLQVVSKPTAAAPPRHPAVQKQRQSMGSQIDDTVFDPESNAKNAELSCAVAGDLTGLASDVSLRHWPENLIDLDKVLERAGVADAPVEHKDDLVIILLHETALWKEIAWKGNTGLRLLKQTLWLSFAEEMSRNGLIFPTPHFPVQHAQFAIDPLSSHSSHAMLQMVLDAEVGVVVEVHCLDRAAELETRLRDGGIKHIDLDGPHVLRVRVSASKVLVDDETKRNAILDDQFGSAAASKVPITKLMNTASSRAYTVLMAVLSELCNCARFEPLTVTWTQRLQLALSMYSVLRRNTKHSALLRPTDHPSMSLHRETPMPSFDTLRWQQVPVLGFVMRERVSSWRSRWVRISSTGRFTDLHGNIDKAECEVICAALGDDIKLIAGRDEDKNLLCWSIARPKPLDSKREASSSETIISDAEHTFEVVTLLRKHGWLLGPQGADHSELILFKEE